MAEGLAQAIAGLFTDTATAIAGPRPPAAGTLATTSAIDKIPTVRPVTLPLPPAFTGPGVASAPGLAGQAACPLLTPSDVGALPWLQVPPGVQQQVSLSIAPASASQNPFPALASGIPLDPEDVLRVRAFGNVGTIPVQFYGRVMGRDGQITPWQITLTTNALATVFTRTVQIGPGILLGAAASTNSGAFTNGTVNAIAELGNLQGSTFVPHTLLFRGQVNDTSPLGGNEAPVQIQEAQYGYYGATSFAGSATARTLTITVPTGKRVRPVWCFTDFTNSAVAGDRGYSYRYAVGALTVWSNGPNLFLGASATGTFFGALDGLLDTAIPPSGNGFGLTTRLTPHTIFYQNVVVSVLYFGAQAGDAFGGLNVIWQEW